MLVLVSHNLFLLLFLLLILHFFIDFPASCSTCIPDHAEVPCSVRLPYSLVPGMDFMSSGFQKALITLGKQSTPQVKPVDPPIAPQGTVNLLSFIIFA